MPQHIWSVLCHKGLLDSYTNQVSLLDVIEQITIRGSKPPTNGQSIAPVAMTLVSLWCRSEHDSPEKFLARLVVVAPDGKEFPGKEMEADLFTAPRVRTFMRFEGLPYHGPGHYSLNVQYRSAPDSRWQVATTVPLDIAFEETVTPKTERTAKRLRKPRRAT